MRKSIFFAAAFAGVLCSCSQDEAIDGGMASGAQDGLVPIEIGVAQVKSAVTRGTGTVGTTDEETNTWAGQKFNVYMFDQGTVTPAEDVEGTAIYNNAVFKAPEAALSTAEGTATAEDGRVQYYPSEGKFDFVGYRTDGAEQGTPSASADGNSLELPIIIDGSQDVMVADAAETELGEVPYDRTFSAYSARKGVDPMLTFEHLLTRLQFTIIGGNEGSCSHLKAGTGEEMGVRVQSVKVESMTNGTLTVATVGEDGRTGKGSIAWQDDVRGDLTLMERTGDANQNLTPMSEVVPTWNEGTGSGDEMKAGEALLVAPANQYKLIVTLAQNVVVNDEGDVEEKEITLNDCIQLDGGQGSQLLGGHSYNVKVTVYGLEEITIDTKLTPWEDGGVIELNPMDEPNVPYAANM